MRKFLVILFIALAAMMVLFVASGKVRVENQEIECIKCETRNTTFLARFRFSKPVEIENIVVELYYDERFVGSDYCTGWNKTKTREVSCILSTRMVKKPGKYKAIFTISINGRDAIISEDYVNIADSGLLPENLDGKRVYQMGENISMHPLYGTSIDSISYSRNLDVLECGNEYYEKLSSCSCENDCKTCMENAKSLCTKTKIEAKPGMKFAVITYSGEPVRPRDASEASRIIGLLFGIGVKSSYYLSVMDEWDNEYPQYLPRKINSTMIIPEGKVFIFEIPENETAKYLIAKKSAKGVAFFIIPVRKDRVLFAVRLGNGG